MDYSRETVIDLPRDRVVALFEDDANRGKWQEGLEEFRTIEGDAGQEGAKSYIRYKMGRREVEMTETIEERRPPERFTGIYEAKGVWNRVENTFTDEGGQTRWRVDTEFRCAGFLGLMARLFPGMFAKQTEKMMAAFKSFAERAA